MTDTGWLAEPSLRRVLAALGAGDGDTRIVGGAVRDALLGRPVGEVDLATRLTPETVMRRTRKAGMEAVPTGLGHGTVTVVCDAKAFEVTTLRVDVATDGRHATVAFTDDWEADARRRDFTMNALYADADGRVFDPLGGHGDVLAGRVRFIGDAGERIGEDYLRILRFFRMHAHFGSGAPDATGLAACIALRGGLAQLSAERVGRELLRLLEAPRPMDALAAMYDSGILLQVLGGVPYLAPLRRLAELEAAHGLEPDPVPRLAVLGCQVSEDGERLARRLRLSGKDKERLARMSASRTLAIGSKEADLRDAGLKLCLYRRGPDGYRDLVLMAWSHDPDTSHDDAWSDALALPGRWRVDKPGWRGGDVAAHGIPAGPAIGEVLKAAEAAWIAQGYPDDAATQRALLDQAAGDWKKRHDA